MTRVDFYISNCKDETARMALACRITEKAYRLKHKVYLHTSSVEQAQQVDGMLWTFKADSFIPHSLADDDIANQCPVLIGYGQTPENHADVLINLDVSVPAFFSRFERVAELINQDENAREMGRQRFRFYRDRGYALDTHNLND